MSDIYIPELMELDCYWENAIKEAVEDTLHGKRRLRFAMKNRNQINTRLERLGFKPIYTSVNQSGEVTQSAENGKASPEKITSKTEDTKQQTEQMECEDYSMDASVVSGNRKTTHDKRKVEFRKTPVKAKKSNFEFLNEPLDYPTGDEEWDLDSNQSVNFKPNPYFLNWSREFYRFSTGKKTQPRISQIASKKKHRKKLGKKSKPKKKRMSRNSKSVNGKDPGKSEQPRNEEKMGKEPRRDIEVKKSDSDKYASNSVVPTAREPLKKEIVNKEQNQGNSGFEKDRGKPAEAPAPPMEMMDVCEENPVGRFEEHTLNKMTRDNIYVLKGKCRSKKRGRKRISPFIKFYLTVYKELCNVCPIKEIAREAAKRWRSMTEEQKAKYYMRRVK